MKRLEKGQIIEINIPEIGHPVKAVVLDVIKNYVDEGYSCNTTYYTYILYAENKLFTICNQCQRGINTSIEENGKPISEKFENWSDFQYSGIIVDNCEIKSFS